jgi:peptidoglycan/xylan/chitin deacetylase (PgdA/CDA1 family)
MSAHEHAGGDVVPVLVYHSVRDTPPPGLDRWTVTPARFAAHLEAIAASGRTPLQITELADALRGDAPLPPRAVAITLDDGYADNVPALEEVVGRGLAASLYVTTGQLGEPDMLTADALRELATLDRVEIGAHGVHHHRLDELAPAEIAREVQDSRAALENLVGRPIRSFAYPHGMHGQRVRRAIVDAGYASAAAVKNAFSHPGDDPFAIARWIVEADTTPERVAEVLAGRGLPRAWAHERLRTRGFRVVRRVRRSVAVRLGDASLVSRP